jgi:hypothetical protein
MGKFKLTNISWSPTHLEPVPKGAGSASQLLPFEMAYSHLWKGAPGNLICVETRDISPRRSDLGERESRRVVGKNNNQEEIVNFDVASIIVRFIKGIFDSPRSLLLREYTRL